MADYRLNCEGFTVQMGNVARPRVERGLPVNKVNWSDGEDLPYEDRFYIDYGIDDEKKLTIACADGSDRPRMRHRRIDQFSLPAELLRNPVGKGNFDTPVILSRQVEPPIGRAALVGIVDLNQYSARIGAANIMHRGGSIVMQEYAIDIKADDEITTAGVSLLLMLGNTAVTVRQEYKSGTRDTDFSLEYRPANATGILVTPLLGGGPDRRSSAGGGTPEDPESGGSDREPRHPIMPTRSGAEALEPPTEEIVEAYPPHAA